MSLPPPEVVTTQHPVETLLAAAAAITACLVVWQAVRTVMKFVRKVTDTLDDIGGEPERPGVPARPGVMERLQAIEERLGGVESDTRQLQRNHGSHLADAIGRIEEHLTVAAAAALLHQPAPIANTVTIGSEKEPRE
jgi:hypothetical protein